MWKSILHAWMSVKPGLCKTEPTNSTETLKQLVFGNPHIVNHEGKPLGLSGRSEGNSLAKAGYSRVGDFWDPEEKEWKGLSALRLSFHQASRRNIDLIIASIPWDPATSSSIPLIGDWINKKETGQTAPSEWIYQVLETTQSTANALEFKRISRVGRIQATGPHNITIPLEGYEPISHAECSPKTAMEQPLDWPKTSPFQVRNPQSIGFSDLGLSLTSNGIQETGTGNKRETWGMLLSLDIPPRRVTRMPEKRIIPPGLWTSSNI